MNTAPAPERLQIGDWTADLRTGRLTRADEARAVEPRVMELLFLLASRPGEVFSRDRILAALWPDVTVGEDALARSLSKLRRAVGDDPRAPAYVETIPKRGYRLIAAVGPAPELAIVERPLPRRPSKLIMTSAAVLVLTVLTAALFASGLLGRAAPPDPEAALLTRRADDFYFQYTLADNEAAIELYERAVAADPDHAPALAGLANATVQKVIRWPGGRDVRHRDLAEAVAKGRTTSLDARRQLARARALAERAARLDPSDPGVLRALGLVRSAQGELDGAMQAYERALAIDPDAWGVLINLGDVHEMRGDRDGALVFFERAYEAMTRVYERQSAQVRPWYAELGAAIGERHAAAGRLQAAERWHRRVLAHAPFHPGTTAGLARVLEAGGDANAARRLCREMVERTGRSDGCRPFLDPEPAGKTSR